MMSQFLLSAARAVMRPEDWPWLDALVAEASQTRDARRRAFWLLGAAPVAALSALRRSLSDLWLFPVALGLGAALAYVDLQATSRLPYASLLIVTVVLLTWLRPSWSWRWALLAGFGLPAAVALGFEGPYAYDRLDTSYPLLPALVAALVVSWLRSRRWDRARP